MSDLALSTSPRPAPRRNLAVAVTPAAADRASAVVWISVTAAMIGAFMAILNIQITNASLLNIEGGIGTGVDNGSWISTSYLIGEIVVIPLTDYLSRMFSYRNVILSFATLFALFSVACAFTHDLPSMIAMRGFQGFFGGVLIPMAFTLVFTKLPKPQQPIGLAMFALAVTFAPAIGPTIGGYLTENYGWQTIFFVNVIPTIVMVATLYFTLERQPMQLGLLAEGDWFGIVTMAVGLASLQAVLEEGNKDDWFGSPFIVKLAVVAAVSLALFIANELVVEKPLVRLRLLTRRNFGFGTISAVFLGFALFGTGLSAAGLSRPGARLQCRADRNCIGLDRTAATSADPAGAEADAALRHPLHRVHRPGDVCLSSFMNITMSLDYSGDQLCVPNIMRAIGQALTLAPLTAISLGSDGAAGCGGGFRHQQHDAQPRRRHRHRAARHHHDQARAVSFQHHRPVGHLGREEVRARIEQMTNFFMAHGVTDPATAHQQAIIALGNTVKRQALVMGFSDTFAVVGVVLVLSGIAILLTGKPKGGAAAGGGH